MAAIIFYCVYFNLPRVQAQVLTNAKTAVSSVGINTNTEVSVSVDGRAISLSGVVNSDTERADLISAATDASGVASVTDNLELLATSTEDTTVAQSAQAAQETEQGAEQQNAAQETATEAAQQAKLAEAEAAQIAVLEAEQEAQEAQAKLAEVEETAASEAQLAEAEAARQAAELAEAEAAELAARETQLAEAEAARRAAELAEAEAAELAAREAQLAEAEAARRAAELAEADNRAAIEAEKAAAELEAQTKAAAEALLAQALQEARNSNNLAATNNNTEGSSELPPARALDGNVAANLSTNDNDAEVPLDEPDNDESDNNGITTASSGVQPRLRMELDDSTLSLNGDVARSENLLELIQTSMNNFSATYVINRVQVSDDIEEATWLKELVNLIPELAALDNASVRIVESQITIEGEAPSQRIHDRIVDRALSKLDTLSLIEKISVPADASEDDAALTQQEAAQGSPEQSSIQVTDSENLTNTDSSQPVASAEKLAKAFAELQSTTILFESGSDVVTSESRAVIVNIAELLTQFPGVPVGIEGHTDSSGESVANLRLSQLRANSVRDSLTELGVAAERLNSYGFGDGVPIADNETPAGRRLNRRIEFTF